VLLLNKMDLLPYVRFDLATFRGDVDELAPDVEILELSVARGEIDGWLEWVKREVERAAGVQRVPHGPPPAP
jgi:hydrogenase nickel incorporation protein HypB